MEVRLHFSTGVTSREDLVEVSLIGARQERIWRSPTRLLDDLRLRMRPLWSRTVDLPGSETTAEFELEVWFRKA